MTKTIEMDCELFTGDAQVDQNFWKALRTLDILPNVKIWNGPGGGASVVQFTGTDENLRTLLEEQFFFDEEDIEFHMERFYGE